MFRDPDLIGVVESTEFAVSMLAEGEGNVSPAVSDIDVEDAVQLEIQRIMSQFEDHGLSGSEPEIQVDDPPVVADTRPERRRSMFLCWSYGLFTLCRYSQE